MNLSPPDGLTQHTHPTFRQPETSANSSTSPIQIATLDEFQRSLPSIKVKADGSTTQNEGRNSLPSSHPFLDALADLSISIDFAGFASALKAVRKHVSLAKTEAINTRAYLLCDDRTQPNTLGEYALFLLAEHGFGFDIEKCHQQGIDLSAVDHRPGELPTALMKAVQAENLSTALSLLKYATPETLQLKNSDGQTVLQLAQNKGNNELVKAVQPFFIQETALVAHH